MKAFGAFSKISKILCQVKMNIYKYFGIFSKYLLPLNIYQYLLNIAKYLWAILEYHPPCSQTCWNKFRAPAHIQIQTSDNICMHCLVEQTAEPRMLHSCGALWAAVVVIIAADAALRVSFVITKLHNIQHHLELGNLDKFVHADNYLIVSILGLI